MLQIAPVHDMSSIAILSINSIEIVRLKFIVDKIKELIRRRSFWQ